ncbi:MAG: biosynthetic arginine decarboxylase [Oligoflexia bacterium]|nr:biosynthetic arginine decarboxylase [Oligoflexia bacterium]
MVEPWNINKSSELYGIQNWGDGYFFVTPQGTIGVRPERNGRELDLHKVLSSLIERDIRPPLLLRFDGILKDRVKRIARAFSSAISELNYTGRYMGVYPIKVNQQRHVVDVMRIAGKETRLGLEVGSKPELIAVLAIHDTPDALLLCNGYKDDEYIELALMGRKIGRRVIIIIEQPYELTQIMEISARLGVEPEIGIRMKPTTKGSGHWTNDTGDKAKFGLTVSEIVTVIDRLKREGKDHWLKLLHFHAGSQTPSIASIKRRLKETARMYVELAKLCPSMSLFDAGGGLAVDYDGSRTNSHSSMNYTVEEYARDMVDALAEACNAEGVPHPDLVTESGRALSAHHAVLIMDVVDTAWSPRGVSQLPLPPTDHEVLTKLFSMFNDLSVKNCHETLNDALALRDEIVERFNQGDLSLIERAYADRAMWHLVHRIKVLSASLRFVPEDLARLGDELRDVFFCNFSMFQSAPDSWAVDQLFPIMPIHRLNEEPTCEASLADMCCDSEGKIDRFIDPKDVKSFVKLHSPKPGQPYYLGIFLVGAYQEVLGDLHNLFGDTHAVHIDLRDNSEGVPEVQITHIVEGDTVREVLEAVEYHAPDLMERLRISTEKGLREGTITNEQAARIQKQFKEAIEGYTYFESN